jgi:predicted nucleotidyltransferase
MDMREQHRKVADRFRDGIMNDPRVEGIAYLGGLARDFADEDSDIDIAVFSSEHLSDVRLGEQITPEGYDLEVWNIVLNEGFEKWSDIQKEAYQEGKIITDKNGKAAEFLKQALEYPVSYKVKKALELIFAIAWHGWIYTPYRNKKVKSYSWILPEDLWFKRGSEKNAYYVSQISVGYMLELMFVINKKWCPDYKWRYLKCLKLPVLPQNAKDSFDFLLFESWNMKTWEEKRRVMQKLVDDTVELLLPDLPDDNWYDFLGH